MGNSWLINGSQICLAVKTQLSFQLVDFPSSQPSDRLISWVQISKRKLRNLLETKTNLNHFRNIKVLIIKGLKSQGLQSDSKANSSHCEPFRGASANACSPFPKGNGFPGVCDHECPYGLPPKQTVSLHYTISIHCRKRRCQSHNRTYIKIFNKWRHKRAGRTLQHIVVPMILASPGPGLQIRETPSEGQASEGLGSVTCTVTWAATGHRQLESGDFVNRKMFRKYVGTKKL